MTQICIVVMLAALALLSAVMANAEPRSTTFRNSMGQEVGRAERQGGTTLYYDSLGRQTGRAERQGGTTIYYDNMGRQIGTARERK